MRTYETLRISLLILCALSSIAESAFATDGFYDTTWATWAGSGGYALFSADRGQPNSNSTANQLLPGPSGGVLLAGNLENGGYWIGELLADGNFAPTFGPSDGSGRFLNLAGGSFPTVLDVGNPRFLVLSSTRLARINVSTNLEEAGTSLGNLVINDAGGVFVEIDYIVVQPDSKVIASGIATYSTADRIYRLAVARFNSDLTLDTSFNAITDGQGVTFAGGALFDKGYSGPLLLQPDGRIVLTGSGATSAGSFDGSVRVLRINPDGSLDNSFGTAGEFSFSAVSPFFIQSAIAVTTDRAGRIIAALLENGVGRMGIVAVTPNGQISFYSFPSTPSLGSGCTSAQSNAVAVDSGGRILLAGYCTGPNGQYFLVDRLKGNGATDLSFGTNGSSYGYYQSGATDNYAGAVLFDSSGHPVLAGGASTDGGSTFHSGIARLAYDLIYTNNFETTQPGCLSPDCP